jgi:4'-phosphopantetheinyl transferase EntD
MSEQRIDPGPLPPFASFSSVHRAEESPGVVLAEELALLRPETVESRRESFRLGRQAAHQALHGLGRDNGPILAGDNREPIWPDGVVGSIAHAAGCGVALVAPSEHSDGIGIDLEARRPAPELADLGPRSARGWTT